MKEEILTNKIRPIKKGLYLIALERIIGCKKVGREVIEFPIIFSKLSTSFSIQKKQVWEILFLLHDLGLIQIVCGKGVRVNYKILKNV